MDKLWRKLGLPLLIIIIGSILYSLVGSLNFNGENVVLELIKAFAFFAFGMALNTYKKKRSSAWVGKLIISFVMFFFIFFSLGYFKDFYGVINTLSFIGLTHRVMAIPLIYVLCGFLFFD